MKVSIGVDIGGTRVKLGIVRGEKVLLQQSFPTERIASSPQALEQGIGAAVEGLRASFRGSAESVGIGVPGLVLYPQGIVQTCANVRGWKEVPLRARLQRRLKIPVRVDNDVHAMTLAEWHYGAGQGASNLVCVTLGTGVGGGFVLGGRLYRSRFGPSAEIGHVPIGEKGPACSCGGTGCLERYVGNRDVIRSLRRKLQARAKSRLIRLVDGRLDRLTPEIVDRACALGDRVALETWEEAGKKIGLVLAKVVNLLSPDRIVIGGGLSRAGRWLFGPIRRTLRDRAMRPLGAVPVVPAKLGMSAGVVGAALLGREAVRE